MRVSTVRIVVAWGVCAAAKSTRSMPCASEETNTVNSPEGGTVKRYYLAEIEQFEFEPGMTGYRCRASAYTDLLFEGGEILTDPATGIPVHKFALVLVKSRDHARIIADPKMIPLPDVALDVKVSSIHTPTKNAMIAKLKALGVDTSWIATTDGYREVIRGIGKINNPAFDENNFDVNE